MIMQLTGDDKSLRLLMSVFFMCYFNENLFAIEGYIGLGLIFTICYPYPREIIAWAVPQTTTYANYPLIREITYQ